MKERTRLPEKWIWLSPEKYPACQHTKYYSGNDCPDAVYTVAEFRREYVFTAKVRHLTLTVSGDTAFCLYLNGDRILTGPVPGESEFMNSDRPRSKHYAMTVDLTPDTDRLSFFARVKMMPVEPFETSRGHGGFMLSGLVTEESGVKTVIMTDEAWLARRDNACVSVATYDDRLPSDDFAPAVVADNIWHTEQTNLLPLEEHTISFGEITVAPGETYEEIFDLDRIHAAVLGFDVQTNGLLEISAAVHELKDIYYSSEELVFTRNGSYRGFKIHSFGGMRLKIVNRGTEKAMVKPCAFTRHYPTPVTAKTVTSDSELNAILDSCRHALKYCRQHVHLDSTKHCEPLACTGDYYIESLMTAFSFGDLALAEADVIRTGALFNHNDGKIYHTTYSLIWVQMLYDVYMLTGHEDLLRECLSPLLILLRRFEGYLGGNGLIETPINYMFIDWLFVDGMSLHHPPKALGQSCMNMFFYGALRTAEKIFRVLGDDGMENHCRECADNLRTAINALLYDQEKGMFFEGLNTPTNAELVSPRMPQNVEKRYYRKHANILAACFGVCPPETCREIIAKIMTDEIPGEYQPYFAHFLLEAVYRSGLRERYTMAILDQWRKPHRDCPKGLQEGFYAPEPGYNFDHSHAWGGTPLYALPLALTGMKILEPGMKKLSFSPALLGLAQADIQIPTPYGMVSVRLEAGKTPQIIAPDGIEIV